MKNHQTYPQYAFDLCLDLTERVYRVGGVVHSDELARSMDRTNSGAFRVLISAAVKHGLLAYKDYTIYLSVLGKELVTAEDAEKKHELKVRAFLMPTVYAQVVKEWGSGIDESNLEHQLVTMGVDKAQVVKRNFLVGAKELGVLQDKENEAHGEKQNKLDFAATEESHQEGNGDEQEEGEDTAQALNAEPAISQDEQAMIETSKTKPMVETNSNPNEAAYAAPSKGVVKVQTLLTGLRVAELTVPGSLSNKDFEILKAWLEVLKMSIQEQE